MSPLNGRLPNYAIASAAQVQRYAEGTKDGLYALTSAEKYWRDHYLYLEGLGYRLRPRYAPDWTPSWIGTNLVPIYCEDSIRLVLYHIIDATRTRDNFRVAIKRIPRNTAESEMAQRLTSQELLQDPLNHCVPVLDVLPDPLDENTSFMIMPYLRPFNDPEFGAIGEIVDFVRQTLEGLHFLHSQRIAHRDCAEANIMMDGRPLYPHDHHPVRLNYSPDGIYELTPLSRIDQSIRYYFIDFELSVHFPEGTTPYALGRIGRDKEVPELSADVPYDAFKVDIYALGNLYDKEFMGKYHGLEFLQPLIKAMKDKEPQNRPTAEAALVMFEQIRTRLQSSLLRWRLRSRTESAPERVVYDTVAVAREGIYHLKRLVT